jgi:hypothetical protein
MNQHPAVMFEIIALNQILYSRGRTRMGYLDTLRLHFTGQFQFNISMVNNAPAHFR